MAAVTLLRCTMHDLAVTACGASVCGLSRNKDNELNGAFSLRQPHSMTCVVRCI